MKIGALKLIFLVIIFLYIPGNIHAGSVSVFPTLTVSVSNSTAILSWNAVENATYYKIYRRSGTNNWNLILDNFLSITYSNTNLLVGTYEYYVDACNTDGCASNTSNTRTPIIVTIINPLDRPPAAPSDLAATVSGTEIILTWKDNSDNESYFSINWWVDEGSVARGGTSVSDNSTREVFQRIYAGTHTYKFTIASANPYGRSASIGPVSVIVTSGESAMPPATPSNLSAVVSGTDIRLTWTDNSDNEDFFSLEYTDPCSRGGIGVAPNTTNYLVFNLLSGTYSYRVRAYNKYGSSDFSNTATVTIIGGRAPVPPKPPSDFTASASNGDVSFTWKDNSDNETSFSINWTRDGGVSRGGYGMGVNQTSAVLRAMPSGVYAFTILSRNECGPSAEIPLPSTVKVTIASIPPLPSTPTPTSTLPEEKKITICHIPPGNPAEKNTITIGESALGAHLAHGDTLGECKEESVSTSTPSSTSTSTPSEGKGKPQVPPGQENREMKNLIENLRAQIKLLEEQLKTLQAELNTKRKESDEMRTEIEALKDALKDKQTLKQGVRDESVKSLQRLLSEDSNIYPEGLVTGYFGKLTEKAVGRFQDKYDIPSTGVVDTETTRKLEEVLDEEKNKNVPKIFEISPSAGPFGTQVKLSGQNFTTEKNQIRIQSQTYLSDLSSSDGVTLSFTLSDNASCLVGASCPIKVINANGISNAAPFKITETTP